MIRQAILTGGCIFLAMILGLLSNSLFNTGEYLGGIVDYLVLALVFMVLLDAPLAKMVTAIKQPKVLVIVWLTNFICIPVLGYFISKLFLPNQPLIAIGLAVYFMFPCTDWFLGFTRMANGNTALGSVLLPINMLTQLLLYPVYLSLIAQETVADVTVQDIVSTLVNWSLIPAVAALLIKLLAHKLSIDIQKYSSAVTNVLIYALVFAIFSANIEQITSNYSVFFKILLTVSVFFIFVTVITEIVAKLFTLSYEDHVLYSITTTARNAPLMLGLTMSALPDQPLIYAAIVIGMLIEFPYLALQVMRFRLQSKKGVVQQIFSEARQS